MQRSDSGKTTVKTVVTLAFLATVVYVSFKVIPVYVNSYELEDFIRSQNPFWLTQHAPAEAIRDQVLNKARELELPVGRDQVNVQFGGGSVTVSADYTVPVDLKVYTLNLHFTPSAVNRQL